MNEHSVFLLVEDNEDDVFFMKRAFRDAGLVNPLHVVNNGHRAIEYISGEGNFSDRTQHPSPHLIFLDLKMPGLDGFEVLTWIRRTQGSAMPIAILTSSPEDRDRKRAETLGANCYLLKPPTREMLRTCCQNFGLNCR